MKNFPPLSRFAVQESLKTTPGSRSSAKFSISAALHAFTAILLCTAAGLTLLSFAAVSLPAIPSLANEPTADTENAAQTFSQTFPLNLPGQEYTAESSKGQLVGILPKHVNQNYFGWQVSRVKSQIVEENGVSYRFCVYERI